MNETNQRAEKKPFNKRKLKYGSAAALITVMVIAIVVIINLIAVSLTEKKGLKLDLTSEKYYDISQDTIDYIKNVDRDVDIEVLLEKKSLEGSSYYKMVLETLAKYEQNSDHIKVRYHDIAKEPDIVSKYSAKYNGDLKQGDIIIACGDRVKVTSVPELFDTQSDYSTGGTSVGGYKGEQEITSAVMNVTNADPVSVGIIDTYNGQAIYHSNLNFDIESLKELLDKNGYDCRSLDILTDGISPKDYDMIVLPAPVNDLTEDCVKKLDDFLKNDGRLDRKMIYIADDYQRKTPNIDAFLEIWGIKVGSNLIYELDSNMLQQVNVKRNGYGIVQQGTAPVVSAADESFNEGLSNTKLPIVAPETRNIELLFDANVDRTTKAILKSSKTSVLRPLEGSENFDPSTARQQESAVMAMASKTASEGDAVHKSDLLVFGSASLTDPMITGVTVFNNAEFVVNTINKMCGKENGIIIAEKKFDSSVVDITEHQARVVRNILMFAVPLAVCVIGAVVFIRRRNK